MRDRESGTVYLSGQLYRAVVPDGSCFTLEERQPLSHWSAGAISDSKAPELYPELDGAAGVDSAVESGHYGSLRAKGQGQGQGQHGTRAGGTRACYITLAKMNRELIARCGQTGPLIQGGGHPNTS